MKGGSSRDSHAFRRFADVSARSWTSMLCCLRSQAELRPVPQHNCYTAVGCVGTAAIRYQFSCEDRIGKSTRSPEGLYWRHG